VYALPSRRPALLPMQDPTDPLEPLLDHLGRQTPRLNGSLTPEVWRRIAVVEDRARRGVFAQLHAVFARRSFAAAFVVGCVLLGMFLAEIRRSRVQADYDRELVRSYLRLIDPRREEEDEKARPKNSEAENSAPRSRTRRAAGVPGSLSVS
jgi:hypothetical protein